MTLLSPEFTSTSLHFIPVYPVVSWEKLAPSHWPKHLLELPTLTADRARARFQQLPSVKGNDCCKHPTTPSVSAPLLTVLSKPKMNGKIWWGCSIRSPCHTLMSVWWGVCPSLKTPNSKWQDVLFRYIPCWPAEFSCVWIVYGLHFHSLHSLTVKKQL